MQNITVNIIQSMLAPAVMISACGLLLLALNNKYSLVINRIRILDEEKRNLLRLKQKGEMFDFESKRIENIKSQIRLLIIRTRLVRNSVLLYSFAVATFILDSILLGLPLLMNEIKINIASIIVFLTGMIFVLIGVIYSIRETIIGYKVIKIELNE